MHLLTALILVLPPGDGNDETILPPGKTRVVSTYALPYADDPGHEADPFPRMAPPAVPRASPSGTARAAAGDGPAARRCARATSAIPVRRRGSGRPPDAYERAVAQSIGPASKLALNLVNTRSHASSK